MGEKAEISLRSIPVNRLASLGGCSVQARELPTKEKVSAEKDQAGTDNKRCKNEKGMPRCTPIAMRIVQFGSGCEVNVTSVSRESESYQEEQTHAKVAQGPSTISQRFHIQRVMFCQTGT
ncbi:hypothetical protein ACFQMA_04810 [Halosimplex aquaticum]|uniref:Uncharacterized protein n=1 Tax=Halosimplex aquaticum TaxID=3026162 RepID=A0ABD5XVJ1_9EURY|nr:hypothetical protein [Halosimplex aquaticum]